MPKIPVFGCVELKRALKDLGFSIDETRGKGDHDLGFHPTLKPVQGQKPFITIPNWKEYADPNFRGQIVTEIFRFGISKQDIIDALQGRYKKRK